MGAACVYLKAEEALTGEEAPKADGEPRAQGEPQAEEEPKARLRSVPLWGNDLRRDMGGARRCRGFV